MNINQQSNLSALDVAAYFTQLDNVRDVEDGITNMKLQKLLYYAQGYHLAYFDKPLFEDSIQAWQYGPVVPSVYNKLKNFGRKPVEFKNEFKEVSIPDSDTKDLLNAVFEQLGQYSAWKLMEMTHNEDPWKSTELTYEITNDKLRSYFKTQIA